MNSELTPKQEAFLEAYYNPNSETFGNGVRSVLKIYDTTDYHTACVIASENLRKPDIQRIMEAKGLGIDRLMKVMDEGLEANKVVSAVITGKDADSRTDDFIEVPDHPTRHKFLETAGKWAKLSPEKEIEVKGDGKIEVVVKDYQ
jgi:hypothetical protein